MEGSTLTGNLTAYEDSWLFSTANIVEGNVVGDHADVVQIHGGTVTGDIRIEGSTFPGGPFYDLDAVYIHDAVVLKGDIQLVRNDARLGSAMLIINVTLNKGSIQVEENSNGFLLSENTVAKDLQVLANTGGMNVWDNTVAKDVEVFRNTGTNSKSVTGNMVGHDLRCFENDPPFVGGPNTAHRAEGQCFVGTP